MRVYIKVNNKSILNEFNQKHILLFTLVILEMIAVPILERELEKKWRARLEHIFIKPKWVRKKRLVTSALKRDDDEYEHTYITWSGSIE